LRMRARRPPTFKEFYHFGREYWPNEPYYMGPEGRNYFIPNLWPAQPEGFADAAVVYYAEMETLAAFLMQLTALALDLDEHFFDDKIDRHITAMRLNFYPEQTRAPKPGQLRAGAHTDYGLSRSSMARACRAACRCLPGRVNGSASRLTPRRLS
jgi:isopenicillin N synthase-like dioxygenase